MKHKKLIAGMLAATMIFGQALSVRAVEDSDIQAMQAEMQATQNAQSELNASIYNLETEKEALLGDIDDIEVQLVNTIASINFLDNQILETTVALDQTTINLAAAEERKSVQYEAMKKRIQYLYEKGGDAGWAVVLLEESSITDFLNQAEYTQKMYDYDRQCLEEYANTVIEVATLQAQYTSEKITLEDAKAGKEEEQGYLEELQAQMMATYDDYEVRIASASEKAAAYSELLIQQNAQVQELIRVQAAEQAAAAAAAAAAEAERQYQAELERQRQEQQNQPAQDPVYQAPVQQPVVDAPSAPVVETPAPPVYVEPETPIGDGGNSAAGQAIIDFAVQFVGCPYVLGGNSLTNGTDCSGFVHLVYAHFGYSVARQSASLRSSGYAVSFSELQPGDIICYPHHVALYMGGGTIVHAADESLGIIISPNGLGGAICARRVV